MIPISLTCCGLLRNYIHIGEILNSTAGPDHAQHGKRGRGRYWVGCGFAREREGGRKGGDGKGELGQCGGGGLSENRGGGGKGLQVSCRGVVVVPNGDLRGHQHEANNL